MGQSPFKNVLVNDLVLDKDGKKMSKSRGNTVDPFDLFDRYGADVLRWYLIYVSPPWTPTKFDEEGLKEVESKFFRSIRNVYNFFSLYANTDDVDPSEFFVPYDERPEIDRWILSKFNTLLQESQENMDIFELTRTVRAIQEFVIEDLSNWFIRRNRRRFWSTQLDDDKKSVYNTTYEIMVDLCKIIAPFVPFIAEELYRNLTGEESVHIDYYPKAKVELIDKSLEEKMDLVRNLVALGRASRENVKIKVRQPLREVVIDGKYKEKIEDLVPLIMEELNVKEVVFEEDLSQFMNYSMKPNFKEAGPVLGSRIKVFGKVLAESDAKELAERLEIEGKVVMNLDGTDIEILKDYVQVSISSKEGFNVVMENNLFVILDTTLTSELLNEGYAREFISKVQQMRKANGYEILDNIIIKCRGSERIKEAVDDYKDFIKSETLATEIVFTEEKMSETQDLNGEETGIELSKI
jgi:isoleucyl-tRNA synthetase